MLEVLLRAGRRCWVHSSTDADLAVKLDKQLETPVELPMAEFTERHQGMSRSWDPSPASACFDWPMLLATVTMRCTCRLQQQRHRMHAHSYSGAALHCRSLQQRQISGAHEPLVSRAALFCSLHTGMPTARVADGEGGPAAGTVPRLHALPVSWYAEAHGRCSQMGSPVHERPGSRCAAQAAETGLLHVQWKIAPALAAGCTVVSKPSEMTSLTCLEMAAIMEEVGLPPGVFNLVTGTGPDAGAPLV